MIAPRFGDIFRTNATKAGLLPVILPEAIVSALQDAVEADPGTEVTVDLGRREVRAGASGTGGAAGAARAESAGGVEGAAGIRAPFEIDEHTRWRLMEGLDDIGLTLRHVEEITAFERSRPAWLPVTS